MNDKMIKDIILWASNLNVSYIIKFHEFVEAHLSTKGEEVSEKIENHGVRDEAFVNLQIEKDLYLEHYKRHLIINTFLMLYSHFEEWLYLIWKKIGKNTSLEKSRGSITRFKTFLKNDLNVDLSRNKDWIFIIEAETIRNCLLHANGRVDLVRNKIEMERILNKHRNYLKTKNKRLSPNKEFLEKFFGSIQRTITKIKD